MLSALRVRPDRRPAAAGTGSAECRRSPARRGSLRVRLLRAWGPAGPRAPDQVAGDQRWFPSCRHLRQRFRGGWGRRGGNGRGGAGALDPTDQLLRHRQIALRPHGLHVVQQDGLPEAGRFGESHVAWNGDAEHLRAEAFFRLVGNLFAERKSTRLNSSHQIISYAVFCLKKKKKKRKKT